MEESVDIRLHQLNPVIGDVEGNTQQILSALQAAEKAGIDLLILPELCVCGYLPMDLLEYAAFVAQVAKANKRIIEATGQTALIFGSVAKNNNDKGRFCWNAAMMAQHGSKIAEIHKTLLPVNDVFDEERYFEPNTDFKCVEWQGQRLGLTICEDIWANKSIVQSQSYHVDPVEKLMHEGAEAIINLSASPFTDRKSEDRRQMLKKRAKETKVPVFYVNQAGANADIISDGDSMALNPSGKIIVRAPLFKAAFIDVSWDLSNEVTAIESTPVQLPPRTERVFEALRFGLKEYINKTGVTDKVLLGLSGGMDSSLVACIAVEALGAGNVLGVAMPGEFSSAGSETDAEKLAQNLDIEIKNLSIASIYDAYLKVLAPLFEETAFGVAEENLQSRARGMLLMAIANKFNRFVLNTGNKSELATGYCTLYGDMNGALAVIADLYKTEVFELAQWLNESYYKREVIPSQVFKKPPSAELRPNQEDSDRLPAYDILDNILKLYIEKQQSAEEIVSQKYNKKVVKYIIKLVNDNQFKRLQAPPGLKVHHKAFGKGRRWPLVQHWH